MKPDFGEVVFHSLRQLGHQAIKFRIILRECMLPIFVYAQIGEVLHALVQYRLEKTHNGQLAFKVDVS